MKEILILTKMYRHTKADLIKKYNADKDSWDTLRKTVIYYLLIF